MTRSAFRLLGPAGTALFAALLLVAFFAGPSARPHNASAAPLCAADATDGNADIYPYPTYGYPDTAGEIYLYGANSFEGERAVEVIWGGDLPSQGTLIGGGTIPVFGTSSEDTTFVVPDAPPGDYNVWVCWYDGGTDFYYYEQFTFTVLGAPECGQYDFFQFVDVDSHYVDPATPYPGENAWAEINGLPEGTYSNVYRGEILFDADLPDDPGTHVAMIDDIGGSESFSYAYGNPQIPAEATLGTHTLTFCWYSNPHETWMAYTFEFEVAREPESAIIDNGIVQLGVWDLGHLNVPGGVPSPETGTSSVGLRYLPTGAEATAPGCLCEGWGAADATSGISGYANESVGTNNLTPVSFSSTASTATSVVDVGTILRVTHHYEPSTTT
ncbi:MAG TPA: hypothetical protein VMR52_04010, partial [Dehalococcoidia bacterium]|nr:hypothetical protein [Dehalococcoidia bacterium]